MAQSAKTPLGLNPFFESGATTPIEWKQWFSTLKMAIMARDSIEVDKLLRLKPQPTDLFYHTLPTNDEEFEGETDDEARNREQRNKRRRVDFENESKVIERKGQKPGTRQTQKPKVSFIYHSEQKLEEPIIRKTHTKKWKNAPHTN